MKKCFMLKKYISLQEILQWTRKSFYKIIDGKILILKSKMITNEFEAQDDACAVFMNRHLSLKVIEEKFFLQFCVYHHKLKNSKLQKLKANKATKHQLRRLALCKRHVQIYIIRSANWAAKRDLWAPFQFLFPNCPKQWRRKIFSF